MLLYEKLSYHKFELMDAMECCMENFDHKDKDIRNLAHKLYEEFYEELEEVQQRLDELSQLINQ